MKKNNFFKLSKLAWMMFMAIAVISTSCKKDEDDPIDDPDPDPIVIVLDGTYIKGAGTAAVDFDAIGMMEVTRNEVTQEDRASLKELYIAVKAGTEGFNIITVEGSTHKVMGPGSDFALVEEADLDVDEPKNGLWRGSIVETDTKFTVDVDGLYHVVYDSEIGIVAIAKVDWGIIGGATPGGWGENTAFTAPAFDLNTMTYTIPSVTILENEWKFRYSNGWKIILDADFDLGGGDLGVKVNTNFGGALNALVPGGDNIANDAYANYTITLTYTLGSPTTATFVYESDAEPLAEYPEELHMIGASIGGWDWAVNGIQMIPAHSNPHLFWKIVWIEAGVADAGIKFAPTAEWVGDFGITGDATDGVWAIGSDNIPDVFTTGYYMVVVNLLDETIEVNEPTVYGLGDAFGSWDAAQAATLFTVDNANEVLVSTASTADGNLRIHVAASTLTNGDGNPIDWWQAEFISVAGVIEYRGTGGDQTALPVTAGQIIKLNFRTETAVIE